MIETPRTKKAWSECISWLNARGERHDPHHWALRTLAEDLERELAAALEREAAIRHFCEVEMGWEWFRAEYEIGETSNQSLNNAKKLKEFLESTKP